MRTPSDRPPSVEHRIGALLRRQHGVVARDQLRSLGLSDGAIARRVAKGSLLRVRAGVYAVRHDRLSDGGLWMAAVLSLGGGAVLSHPSAAALWELTRSGLPLVDVTVPRKSGRRTRKHLRIHRSSRLSVQEVTRKRSIPVTRPPRTLLDFAEIASRREVERSVDEAVRLRLCTEQQLHAAIERHPGRRGGALLAALLEEHEAGSTATVNDFEELFLGLCDETGVPRPEVNVWIGLYKVDFLWRRERLVIETDGYGSHSGRTVFEHDHARDVELENAGWRVRRFTWRQLTRRRAWVAEKLVEALSRTRAPPPRSSPRPP